MDVARRPRGSHGGETANSGAGLSSPIHSAQPGHPGLQQMKPMVWVWGPGTGEGGNRSSGRLSHRRVAFWRGARDEGCLATARWTPGGYARSPAPAAEAHSPSTSPAPGPAGRDRPGAGRGGRMPGAAGPWRAAGGSRLPGDADPGPPSVCGGQCARPPFKPSAMTNPRPARNPCSQSQGAWHFRGGHDLPASPPPQARGDGDVSKSGREVGARSS